jgi:hypothetical protein
MLPDRARKSLSPRVFAERRQFQRYSPRLLTGQISRSDNATITVVRCQPAPNGFLLGCKFVRLLGPAELRPFLA